MRSELPISKMVCYKILLELEETFDSFRLLNFIIVKIVFHLHFIVYIALASALSQVNQVDGINAKT